ncbi:MAG: hypothetical protein V3U92_00135 [Cellulophaga sp.]
MKKAHSFHIPVMGIGFTIDSPLKVAQYGMDSVISLVDDILLEKLRKMYSQKFEIPYKEITDKIDDFRAKRITSYLNLINDLVEKKFEVLKNSTLEKGDEIKEYLSLLPDNSSIKEEYKKLTSKNFNIHEIRNWVKENLTLGSIDVNIMTKIDKDNYVKKVKLPVEFNDAHAALRGYAESDLTSSLILSAGMNPRLYAYIEGFDDFYPDVKGVIKKKIVLKVSDYRSALIQGKFLAKKGIWVSEYRIESGLNCGGHAFATNGFLMGPILEEFKNSKQELVSTVFEILAKALENKDRVVPTKELPLLITAQGGVGTAEEHSFLVDYYKVDSVGWGSPFLLVPEATTVDKKTMDLLIDAKEEDLYLSNISPLGVPFNSLKGNTKDIERLSLIARDRPGSSCPKKYVSLNKEFTEQSICTASRQYQYLKIKELKEAELPTKEYQKKYNKIIEKSCICVGLGTSALLVHDINTKVEGQGVAICPGPNMAYYSKVISLKDMVHHIYGKSTVITRTDRPNMFIKELNLYIDYLNEKLEESKDAMDKKQEKYLTTFSKNLNEGISYYNGLFNTFIDSFDKVRNVLLKDLKTCENRLKLIGLELEAIKVIS